MSSSHYGLKCFADIILIKAIDLFNSLFDTYRNVQKISYPSSNLQFPLSLPFYPLANWL